jgi:hypothetical protein
MSSNFPQIPNKQCPRPISFASCRPGHVWREIAKGIWTPGDTLDFTGAIPAELLDLVAEMQPPRDETAGSHCQTIEGIEYRISYGEK